MIQKEYWYKEKWCWLVLSIPVLSVCASAYLVNYAFQYQDDVIGSGYVKQGMSIHLTSQTVDIAHKMGFIYQVNWDSQHVWAYQIGGQSWQEPIQIVFGHPTDDTLDQILNLNADSVNRYYGELVRSLKGTGKWSIKIKDQDKTWMIQQGFYLPLTQIVVKFYAE